MNTSQPVILSPFLANTCQLLVTARASADTTPVLTKLATSQLREVVRVGLGTAQA